MIGLWIVVGFAAQVGQGIFYPYSIGKGIINKKILSRIKMDRRTLGGRFAFLFFWIAVSFGIEAIAHISQVIVYWGGIIILVLDDHLNKDDNYRKYWDLVRNKIKWKMELPQPVNRVAS